MIREIPALPAPPSKRWPNIKAFCLMFAIQFIQYCICSISYRAMAQARYGATFVTDVVFGLNSFFIVKKIAQEEKETQTAAAFGYTLGGALGSLLAIWLTKRMFGS